MGERKQGWWDERTETTMVDCVGGPLDASTIPVAVGVRTVRAPEWNNHYYEIMRYQNALGVALVWQGCTYGFAHHVAKQNADGAA